MALMQRRLNNIVAIVTILGTTGCFTPAVRKSANETTAIGPEIAGVVRDYPFKGERSLIVCYRAAGDGTDVDLVVPIRKDGSPIEPFKVTARVPTTQPDVTIGDGPGTNDGSKKPFVRHAEVPELIGLTPDRLAEIQRTAATIAPDRPKLERHLKSADFTQAARYKPAERDRESTATDTVRLLSYAFDSKGRVWPGESEPNGQTEALIHPRAGVFVIAVPTAVSRPPGDRERNQIVAASLTPLSVTGDAALIGSAFVLVGVLILPVLGGFWLLSEAGAFHP